ncbi:MAG: hypothetical protein QXY52_01300 [Conexivisphaerales archaeon]
MLDLADEKLVDFLKSGKDWSRLKTSVPGIFVLKMPAYRGSPNRLAVEINPVDDSGSPKKKRGLVIRDELELKEFSELVQNDRLKKLVSEIDQINPRKEREKRSDEVLEI